MLQKILFGPWTISPSEIFFTSKHCFGLVNLKPVVPGHVLVISRRVVPRFNELTPEEVSDLLTSGQRIAKEVERIYSAESLTFTIQDGPAAGQSVPHVHLHIIPRKKGDWMNNDDIYEVIDRKERDLARTLKDLATSSEPPTTRQKGPDMERIARSHEEMAGEASELRPLFEHYDNIWQQK
jgi:bis(5'-adenosyl)-triphosphatase